VDSDSLNLNEEVVVRLRTRLKTLYGERADQTLDHLLARMSKYDHLPGQGRKSRWDERDIVLIAYGDQVRHSDHGTLSVLGGFLETTGLDRLINTVHILPFCPYSSDDGFSVVDYRRIDPPLGNWDDVRRLGKRVDLMFDLVLNHVSQQSHWFQAYLAGEEPYTRYFTEVDPDADLSEVTRPRSLPLLTPQETSRGRKHVWTTFSADQIDLNFAEPAVLIEMLDILMFYAEQGARIIRLDAIAYLWKQLGTTCIHLSETHEVVKLMRDVLESIAPHVLLLTETNVPHAENISYFGDSDEAHMVYQFSLPPLLLDALLNEDARPLTAWLRSLGSPPPGTTFFNFTASHDGIGVRPLEGLVPPERLMRLADAVKARGGLVSTRRMADGSDSAYELNITYFDALRGPKPSDPGGHVRRFLASQALMLSLRGIPGVYFHSLVGTPNNHTGVEASGQARRINRRKYDLDDLMQAISDPANHQQSVFSGYQHLLRTRIAQPAFHPDGAQGVGAAGNDRVVAFERISPREDQRIVVLINLSSRTEQIDLGWCDRASGRDLLTGEPVDLRGTFTMDPCQAAWIELD